MSNRKLLEESGRSVSRIIFSPWHREGVGEHEWKMSTWWGDYGTRPEATDPRSLTALSYTGEEIPLMKALGHLDVIYVMGHGSPGGTTISPERSKANPPTKADDLGFDEVCTRLRDSGVQDTWTGDLKLWVCYSAVPREKCFAGSLSGHLHNEMKYKCRVYGYSGEVDIGPKQLLNSVADHHLFGEPLPKSYTIGHRHVLNAGKEVQGRAKHFRQRYQDGVAVFN